MSAIETRKALLVLFHIAVVAMGLPSSSDAMAQQTVKGGRGAALGAPCPPEASTAHSFPEGTAITVLALHPSDVNVGSKIAGLLPLAGYGGFRLMEGCWFEGAMVDVYGQHQGFTRAAIRPTPPPAPRPPVEPTHLDAPVGSGPVPTTPGQCQVTRIARLGSRLVGGDFGMGVSIVFKNGIGLVDYAPNPVIVQQQAGDVVTVCLVSLPTNCPPGDDRGKTYSVYDHRQQATYTMADSSHMCGGA